MDNPQQHTFFQYALLAIFGFFAIAGVVTLAIYRAKEMQSVIKVPITIWGPPFKDDALDNVLNSIKKEDPSFEKVSYVEKNPATLYGDLLEAIVTGNGPDLVVMDSSGLLPLKNKLYPISFETLPKSTLQDVYIEGAEIFTLQDGTYALPLLVDPLVLYWNRDLFAAAAVAQVPKDWDTFVQTVPRLRRTVNDADLTQGAIAFGEYDNVLYAKEIMSALFMQTGVSIVKFDPALKKFKIDLLKNVNTIKPQLALSFYTAFSNPVKTVYSWNKTFDRSREAFAANKVAMYGGFVSEESTLTEINPNLNFGMALWPQSNNTHRAVTYGKFYGIAVLRSSGNPAVSLYVAQMLASKENAKKLSEYAKLPSVRRDVLNTFDETDPFGQVKVQSSIMSHSWLEPAPKSVVEDIFQDAINKIVSGVMGVDDAIVTITKDMDALLEQYIDES